MNPNFTILGYIRSGEPLIANLWNHWSNAYPQLQFTNDVLYAINSEMTMGDFATALLQNDLGTAFNYADASNLPLLERLSGITKQEYGETYWGWPKNQKEKRIITEN